MAGQHYPHWTEVPPFLWDLCPNFNPKTDIKLVSPDTGEIYFDIESFQALQRFRDFLGPVRVLSGYRSEIYNARVGGAARSYHYKRIAFDVAVQPYDIRDMARAASEAGFSGIGYYPSRGFIHLDLGRSRTWYGSQRDKRIMTQTPDVLL